MFLHTKFNEDRSRIDSALSALSIARYVEKKKI